MRKIQITIGLITITLIVIFSVLSLRALAHWLGELNSELVATLITAFSTIVAAAITLAYGRYSERIKETEAHFRTSKVQMYDEFLKEIFGLLNDTKDTQAQDTSSNELVSFLKEWQRQLVLWGGDDVLAAYIKWKNHLSARAPDASSIFFLEDLYRAMRADVGLSSKKIKKGDFAHLHLKNAKLLLDQAKINPDVTLSEISKLEKELGLE